MRNIRGVGLIPVLVIIILISQSSSTEILHQRDSSSQHSTQPPGHAIPKTIWLYDSPLSDKQSDSLIINQTLLQQLNLLNIQFYAKQQNYTIKEVSSQNFDSYFSQQTSTKIYSAINSLKSQSQDSLGNQTIQQITKRMIVYALLKDNGGVFIDKNVTLVQNLDTFFSEVQNLDIVNGGNKFYDVNQVDYCIGFFNETFSSYPVNLNHDINNSPSNKENFWTFKPNIVLSPNLEDYFIACPKHNIFIDNLFETYTKIITQGRSWTQQNEITINEQFTGKTNLSSFYYNAHYIAIHYLWQNQNLKQKSYQQNKFSLPLLTINSRLVPQKFKTQFALNDNIKMSEYLSKLTIEELQIANGRLKGAFKFDSGLQNLITKKLLSPEKEDEFWIKGSFGHKHWIRHLEKVQNDQRFKFVWKNVKEFDVVKNIDQYTEIDQNGRKRLSLELISSLPLQNEQKEVPTIKFDKNKAQWQSLNKHIWIIWDNGVEGKSNLIVELCYENLKRSAKNSGFEIHSVSRDKIHTYLSAQILQKINNSLNNVSFDLSRQAISDLWRMALVYEHGGIYFDASTFMMDESFDWILNLTQIQQNLIWNRYGQQPEVFMLWNTFYGSPLEWQNDKQHNTRKQWHLSYENNFIISVKGAKLIKEWLDTMLEWITLPYMDTEKQIIEAGTMEHKWTWDSRWYLQSGRYLTAMDSLKVVMGRREVLLNKQKQLSATKEKDDKYANSADYYRLWSMPGQLIGQQKLRGEMNYEHLHFTLSGYQKSYNTIYKYQYPLLYIQQVLGPLSFQGKFFSRQLTFMNKFINDFYLQNQEHFTLQKLHSVIHPESILSQKLFNVDPEKTISLIKHYAKTTKMQRNLKAFSKVWIY